MPFDFLAWSRERAEEFFDEYREGIPARFDTFVEAVRAGGGPAGAVTSLEPSGLVEAWAWFVETYGSEQPLAPISDAGFSCEAPFWLTPVEWYRVGPEGLYVASGFGSWVLMLLRDRFDMFPLQLDLDPRSGTQNKPLVPSGGFPDSVLGGMARRVCDPQWYPQYREPEFLLDYFNKALADCEKQVAKGLFVERMTNRFPGAAPPEVNIGLDDVGDVEAEIEFDELIEWPRRERFETGLRASALLRGVRSSDDREAMFVTWHGDIEDFRSEVARIWEQSRKA